MQVSSSKQHTPGHPKAALGKLLDDLGHTAPALVLCDSDYGSGDILGRCKSETSPACCG
ncbi:hypothetical protein AACH06_08660 [Ideonella sp. DXS29W]|uniref:Transposase IS701-like DDE domain-containing protein n=1 Tax=Ideonella lacteola TaxID=2984193 RepID=A0ABU9BLQ5_9BURK